MTNKTSIKVMCVAIGLGLPMTGCMPTRYAITNTHLSVYGKHCRPIAEEHCQPGTCDKYVLGEKFVNLKANDLTVTVNSDGLADSAIYFHCGPEEPPYLVKPTKVSIVRNTINQAATAADLKQSTAECEYEAHKATVDTSAPAPTRVFVPTSNYWVNNAQLNAIRDDETQQTLHKLNLSSEKQKLTNECLKVKGFVFAKSTDKKDIDDFYKYCPDLDGYIDTCFISGIQK